MMLTEVARDTFAPLFHAIKFPFNNRENRKILSHMEMYRFPIVGMLVRF